MRIYLDNCCLNRPFDEMSSPQIVLESEAVLSIIDRCEQSNEWLFYSSDILDKEIEKNTNFIKRENVLSLYQAANEHIGLNEVSYTFV